MNENYMERVTVADAIALNKLLESYSSVCGCDIDELDTMHILKYAEKETLETLIERAHEEV